MPASPPPLPRRAAPPRPYRPRLVIWLSLAAGLVLGLWLLGTPPGALGKADAVGYAICHRIPERTFHVHDRPLPLCARCTGIYLGVMAALAVFAARGQLRAGKLPPARVLLVLLGTGAAYGLDGLNSYLSLFDAYQPVYQPHNTLRLLTGAGFGVAMITVVWPVFNALAWQAPAEVASAASGRDLLALYGSAGLVCAAVLTEAPAVLVVAGLVSAAGVALMFGIIGAVIFFTLTGRDNTVTRWRELAVPALAGLIFALIVIGSIDAARYLLTGSWEGFTLE